MNTFLSRLYSISLFFFFFFYPTLLIRNRYFPPCTPEGLTLRVCVDTCVSFATQCLERYNPNFLCNLTTFTSPTTTQCEPLPQGSPESP
jgi:hypothetical protein